MEERDSIDIPFCSICKDQIAIYRCPRCFERTCSLACCLSHKGQSGCDGKRSRVAYVPLHQFNDSTLSSDYHFLEDVLAKSERGKRLIKEIGASMTPSQKRNASNKRRKLDDTNKKHYENEDKDETFQSLPIQPLLNLKVDDETVAPNDVSKNGSNHNMKSNPILNSEKGSALPHIKSSMDEDNLLSKYPHQKQKFVRQAHERGIRLLLMAPGMQRHIMNSTKYDAKRNLINWKVEFIIHSFPPKIDDENKTKTKERDEKASKIILTSDRIPESDSLYGHLSKLFELNISHAAPVATRSRLIHFCNSSNTKIIKDDVCALMKRIPCKSSQPTYRRVNLHTTLKDILRGITVIEFPTVEIIKEENIGKFSVFIEEIKMQQQN